MLETCIYTLYTMFRNFVGREQQRSSRNGVNGLKFATTKIPRRWITDLFNGQIPREFGCPADKSFVFDPREKLHPPLREVSSVSPPLPSLYIDARAGVYACAFLEFLKGVSHRVSVFHEARPSLSSTPIFAQKSRVCYTAKVVRRRNGTLRVEGCVGFGLCLLPG